MKAAAELIAYSTLRHAIERRAKRGRARRVGPLALEANQERERARVGKFRRVAESAVLAIDVREKPVACLE
jgi:hypothetical protein